MLFARNQSAWADDGVVLEEEWSTLRSSARADRVKLARRLRAGMSVRALEALDKAKRINLALLSDHGLMSVSDWDSAVKRGRTEGRLSEVVLRYLRIHAIATEIWGAEKAADWLQRANRALDGETPISLIDSDQGAQAVEALLGQIEHGLHS